MPEGCCVIELRDSDPQEVAGQLGIKVDQPGSFYGVRERLEVPAGTAEDPLKQAALASPKVTAAIGGRRIEKVIVVPGRLVSIVTER